MLKKLSFNYLSKVKTFYAFQFSFENIKNNNMEYTIYFNYKKSDKVGTKEFFIYKVEKFIYYVMVGLI